MSKLFGVENFRRAVMKGDDQLMGAKMARRIAKLIRRKPDILQEHPDWDKHKDADIKMQEAAQETKDRKRESNPGPVHEDTAQDDGTEKARGLLIGPKEGRVPSYGNHSGHPTGRAAPSLPLSTMGKSESFFIKGADGHVASVAVMHKDKILMGKRRDNGRWTLPGGHLEKDEDPHDGGIRELHEEAGIKAKKLHHLKSSTIKTHTGKEKTIHAFKFEIPGEKPPKTSMKNDPDQEVHRWKWVVPVDGKLPKHIKENLHSPKNMVLEEMGLMKARFVVETMMKSRPHKYIRKYKGRNGEWIYIYHEGEQHHRISEEDVAAHRHLAEHGDESERAHHAELVSRIQEMTSEDVDAHKMLAQHGDESERAHHGSILRHLGHKKEDLGTLDKIAARADADETDQELPAAKAHEAREAVHKEINDAITYLGQHMSTPVAAALVPAMRDDKLVEKIRAAKTIRQVMDAMHGIAKKLEQVQGTMTSQNSGVSRNGGTYGNMIYNQALASLAQKNIIPKSFADEHKREAKATTHEVKSLKDHKERVERLEAKRAERERRELGELHGSMAFHMASLMEAGGSNRVQKAREIDQTIRNIFGKSLKKEDWPYNFESEGLTVKISSVSAGGSSMSLSMNVYDADGNQIMEQWSRDWSKRDGRPHIYNSIMVVKAQYRGVAKVGDLINRGQRELMKAQPRGGTIGVTAALDVGGYNWANQGFSFSDSSTLRSMRQTFQLFCQEKGVHLTNSDLEAFTEPVHFAAFTDGKKYVKQLAKPFKLTPEQVRTRSLSGVEGEHTLSAEEVREGKSKRMLCHLGKMFLLGRHWSGTWDSRENNATTRYADSYRQMRERATKMLEPEYKAVLGATSEGQRSRAAARPTTVTPRASLGGGANAPNREYVDQRIRAWSARLGGVSGRANIRMTKTRIDRILRWPRQDVEHFLASAPLTHAARRTIATRLREGQ